MIVNVDKLPKKKLDPEILCLLEKGRMKDAIIKWLAVSKYGQENKGKCLWGGKPELIKCANCLEGRLRSLSLSYHTSDYAKAMAQYARMLNVWHEKLEKSTISEISLCDDTK